MTDLIQKARKEWCDPYVVNPLCAKDAHYKTRPTYVVAALLDVLDEVMRADSCPSCFGHRVYKHRPGCITETAQKTITTALEEK